MTQAPVTVRICHLYPSLLSVAGDRGNLLTLMQRCAWRGIRYSVTEADVGAVPDFAQSDLILLHGGQDREMTAAADDLAAKAGPLREAIEAGAVVLAVCAGYQLLGRYYAPVGGPVIEGLGVLDAVTEAGPTRFIGHVAAECDLGSGQRQLTGFENHSGRTYLGGGAEPFGRVLAGAGNNGEDGTEGARYREVYATYLHGPVLPKNPWLADHLLTRALAHRYTDFGPLAPLTDQVETRAHAAALRLARRGMKRGRPVGGWNAPGRRRVGGKRRVARRRSAAGRKAADRRSEAAATSVTGQPPPAPAVGPDVRDRAAAAGAGHD
jgi:lipid II isoglutaminyl synthase (glutamine-hydrolysing)